MVSIENKLFELNRCHAAKNKIEDFFLKGTSAYGSTFFYGSKFYKVGKTKLSFIQNVPSKKSEIKGNQLGQIRS